MLDYLAHRVDRGFDRLYRCPAVSTLFIIVERVATFAVLIPFAVLAFLVGLFPLRDE